MVVTEARVLHDTEQPCTFADPLHNIDPHFSSCMGMTMVHHCTFLALEMGGGHACCENQVNNLLVGFLTVKHVLHSLHYISAPA